MGIAKPCCLLPGRCQDFPACPCLAGPHKVSSAPSKAGIASVPALCGWVTGLSLGGCQEEHPGPVFSDLLHSSTCSSGLHLLTVLVCVAAITPLVRIPLTKISPGSDGLLVSCCAAPPCLRAYPKWELCSYFFPWQPHSSWLWPLLMLWAWGWRARALQPLAEDSFLL